MGLNHEGIPMTIIKAFTTPSGFEVEPDDNLFDRMRENGFKPQMKTDLLGVRIVTGITDVQELVALLRGFYGENNRVTLRVFAEGSSRDHEDFPL